jgi:3D (Asp-Asp-Asp) domain-containing protein
MKHLTLKHVPLKAMQKRIKLVWDRMLLTSFALVLVATSSNIQIAGASEQKQVSGNTVLEETVKAGDLQALNQAKNPATLPIAKAAETPVMKKPVKRAWNKINAPDLVTLPAYSSEPAVRTMVVPTTAYTSDPAETDSTPFTTANGSQVRDGIVAANFLPFGTRIRIPDYFGNKVFEVHDRMNARYQTRVDLWMLEKSDAYAWGVRNVKIEILK